MKRKRRTRAKKTIYGGGLDQYASAPQDFVAFYLNKGTDENKEKMIKEFEELIQEFKEKEAFKEDDGVIDLNLTTDKNEEEVCMNIVNFLKFFDNKTKQNDVKQLDNNIQYMMIIFSFRLLLNIYINDKKFISKCHDKAFILLIRIALLLNNVRFNGVDYIRKYPGDPDEHPIEELNMFKNAKELFFKTKSLFGNKLSKKQEEYKNFVLNFYQLGDKEAAFHELIFNQLRQNSPSAIADAERREWGNTYMNRWSV